MRAATAAVALPAAFNHGRVRSTADVTVATHSLSDDGNFERVTAPARLPCLVGNDGWCFRGKSTGFLASCLAEKKTLFLLVSERRSLEQSLAVAETVYDADAAREVEEHAP